MPTLQTLTGLFWIESIAYLVCLVANSALALVVFGARRRMNLPFAVLVSVGSIWAISALLLRLSTWLQLGSPALWLELSSLGLFIMGPAQLLFAASHVGYQKRWPTVLAWVLLLIIAAISLPLFQHRMIFGPYFEPNGMLNYSLRPFALASTAIPAVGYGAAFYLFRRASEKIEARYLQISAALWLVGIISGGALRPFFPFPTMSVLLAVSTLALSYGILSSQVFNPLQGIAEELERKVSLRTHELAQSAAELEAANRGLARQRSLLEAAVSVVQTVSATQSPEKQLALAVRTVAVRFGLYHVGLFMLDASGAALRLKAASSDYGQTLVERGYSQPLADPGLLGLAARHAEAQLSLVGDADALNSGWAETRSRIAAPLRSEGAVVGVLDLHSKQRGAFGGADITIFQLLADQLALMLVNAQLVQEAQSRLEVERRAYGELGVREWQTLLASRPSAGYRSDAAGVIPLLARGEALGALPASVEGLPELTLPLELRGRVIGMLTAHKPAAGAGWTDEESTMLQGLVQQLVVALEGARLYEASQRRAARERLIGEISDQIRRVADMETILQTAVTQVGLALGVPYTYVRLGTAAELLRINHED